ncbi:MAG: ornithine carbamoyltransferase [Planctomycetota bacterium]|jgi:N-acetylornithine carbamoyltransferase
MIDPQLHGKDYISTADWGTEEISQLLSLATDLKTRFKKGIPHRWLADKTLFMIFYDKSTRTRNAMEAGITQLGGHAHYIDAETSQLAHGESPKDMGIILSSYGHGIAMRHDLVPGEGNATLRAVAKHADKPVINLQCDVDHPCQTLADLMTLQEHFHTDSLSGMKVAVSWAYAPSYAKPLSVPQGLALLLPRFGADVVIAHPPEFPLMPKVLQQAGELATAGGGSIRFTQAMDDAFQNARVVYPKSWGIQELFGDPRKALAVAARYKDWICDERRMALAAEDGVYMHCLPADRGAEVTDAVIDGPQSVVYEQAENRLHTGKAIMAAVM